MVINAFETDLRMSGENRQNVNSRLGTRSPNLLLGVSAISTYQHRLLQLHTL